MKIQPKTTFFLLAASLFPLVLAIIISYNFAYKSMEEEIINKLESIASIQKHRLVSRLTHNIERVKFITTRVLLRRDMELFTKAPEKFFKERQAEVNQSLHGALSIVRDFRKISVLSLDGKTVASTSPTEIGKNHSNTEYFVKGRAGYSVDTLERDKGQKTALYLSGPVYQSGKQAGKAIGVVVIEADPAILAEITSDYTGLGQTGETVIAKRDRNGDALFIVPLRFDKDAALTRRVPRNELTAPVIQALLKNESAVTESFDYRGKQVLSATRYIAETDWGLVVKIDNAEAFMPINQLRDIFIIIIFITVIGAVAASFCLSRNITGPIINLADTARRINTGDTSIRAAVTSTDEIGVLAGVFNDMTANIIGLNAGLEDKVKKRTEEIRRLNENLNRHAIDLDAINKELEAFNYSVSHDLRAPLRAIDGFSLALLEDYNERLDEQGRDYLQRVRAATQRMGHLIDAMLRLSRLSRSEMRIGTVDLSVIAREITNELSKDQPERKAEFIIQDRMTTKGDVNLLRILLENLIGNAWKFTANTPEPKIEFGVNLEAGDKVYFVRDNGSGFEMAYANKLFAPFQRLHSDTEFPGLGIGLATVKRIIYRHGGTIRAEAEVGKGAAFYFKLNVV